MHWWSHHSRTFLVGKLLINDSTSLLLICSDFLISSLFSFGRLYVSRNVFPSGCQIGWYLSVVLSFDPIYFWVSTVISPLSFITLFICIFFFILSLARVFSILTFQNLVSRFVHLFYWFYGLYLFFCSDLY